MSSFEISNKISIARKLLKMNCFPEVAKEKVSLHVWTDDDYENSRPLTPQELTDLGVSNTYVGAHPEGSDRGGYVPWVETNDGQTTFYYGEYGWQRN